MEKGIDQIIRDKIEQGIEKEETYFPRPVILVVEDKPEEQALANKAVRDSGLLPVVAATLADAQRIMKQLMGKIVGIITDLHFPENDMTKTNNPNPPAGLAIIAIAVEQNLPIAVCSDINHHFAEYIKLVLPALAAHPNYKHGEIFLTFDRKDWPEAIKKLLKLMKGGKS